ncbi:MAG: hypothetical protein Q9168_004012 [Polycauliona sp. 1 TL-2023]
MGQLLWEYVLVYCTSHFLRAIGEPPTIGRGHDGFDPSNQPSSHQPLPITIIFLFSFLVSLRYVATFLLRYVFEVVSTVIIVSSEPISPYAAAVARAHPSMKPNSTPQRTVPDQRIKHSPNVNRQDSLLCSSMERARTAKRSVQSWSTWFLNLPYFRGLNAYVMMSVTQWYLAVIIDFFLSGQPEGLQLGYGSSSVLVSICFGGGAALWTHCAITERSSDYVYNHFPKGSQILCKLFPVTAAWAFSEHIALSLPLALSRYLELTRFASEPYTWSDLGAWSQIFTMLRFFMVYILHLVLVATASIPATMVLRRVHATMLDSEETALVPHYHAQKEISVSEAWSTIDWKAYRRVLAVYIQYYFLDHMIHLLYWSAVHGLHHLCETVHYDTHSLPNAPTSIQIRVFSVG